VSKFIGGSAKSMAHQLMEGYILINPHKLKRFTLEELRSLKSELEKIQRELRVQQIPVEDTQAIQIKNHRLQKISSALLQIRTYCMKVFHRA
jgi:hypothetical protein